MARNIVKRDTLDSKAIAVIGEGITEQYYLNSIPNSKGKLKPKLPQHSTGYKFLEDKINQCIEEGHSIIYVLIDMDNKTNGIEREKYQNFKNKFHNRDKSRNGTKSTIKFFESERCLEIWFLFHFKNTSTKFNNQKDLIDEINKYCRYEKTEKFFKSINGLHQHFHKNRGDLNSAKLNAKNSIIRRDEQNTDYTYSEMYDFFDLIEKKNCE